MSRPSPSNPDFSSLLRESAVLTKHIPDVGIPSIQRNVPQLAAASYKLHIQQPTAAGTRTSTGTIYPTLPATTTPAQSTQAQLFLATTGVDLQQQDRYLQSLTSAINRSTIPTTEQTRGETSLDLESYLEQEHEQMLRDILNESSSSTIENFNRYYIGIQQQEWETQKKDLMEQFGFKTGTTITTSTPYNNTIGSFISPTKTPNKKPTTTPAIHNVARAAAAAFTSPVFSRSIQPPSSTSIQPSDVSPTNNLPFDQSQYGKTIRELNDKRLRHTPFSFVTAMRDTATIIRQQNPSRNNNIDHEIIDLYNLLRYLIQEHDTQNNTYQRNALHEQHYHSAYYAQSAVLRKQLSFGARQYCQQLFIQHMRNSIATQPIMMNQSNTITQQQPQQRSIIHTVQQYVPIAISNISGIQDRFHDYYDNLPLWPQVFYLLRAGYWNYGLEILTKYRDQRSNNSTAITDVSLLITCFSYRLNNNTNSNNNNSNNPNNTSSLSRTLWEQLTDEYNREIVSRLPSPHAAINNNSNINIAANSIDPFKLAIYQLLGHYPPLSQYDIYHYIIDSTESYLWYKLSIIYEDEDTLGNMPDSIFTTNDQILVSFSHLQSSIINKGETQFNADQQHPLLYFKALMLTQCFEYAIAYLIRTQYYGIAIHSAMILYYYGLLRLHDTSDELLVQQPGNHVYAINLQRILTKFVEPWIQSNTEIAFQYLYILYSNPTTATASNRTSPSSISTTAALPTSLLAMRDLLLQSKATTLLVGDISTDPLISSYNGLFFTYFPQHDVVRILQLAADWCVQRGDHTDAIMLLLLASSYEEAARLARQELARLVAGEARDSTRAQMVEITQRLVKVLIVSTSSSSSSSSISLQSLSSLTLLLTVVQFFDHYHLGPDHYNAALDAILSTQLFPLSFDNQTDSRLFQTRLSTLPTEIQRILGQVALTLMDIYYSKYISLRSDHYTTSGIMGDKTIHRGEEDRESIRNECRVRGRTLVDFVGMNNEYIGVDIHAKLLRLEALMT